MSKKYDFIRANKDGRLKQHYLDGCFNTSLTDEEKINKLSDIRNKISKDRLDPNLKQDRREPMESYNEFEKELENDLNFPIAMMTFYKFINNLNQTLSENDKLEVEFLESSFETLEKFLYVIGLEISSLDNEKCAEIEKWILKRNQFRLDKKYEDSDKIRSRLETTYNIELIDHKNYTFWKIKTIDDY